jgi:hypothetical protein
MRQPLRRDLPAKLPTLHKLKRTRYRGIHGGDNLAQMRLQNLPIKHAENYYGEGTPFEILLI